MQPPNDVRDDGRIRDDDAGSLIESLVSAQETAASGNVSPPNSQVSERRDNLDDAERILDEVERQSRGGSSDSRKASGSRSGSSGDGNNRNGGDRADRLTSTGAKSPKRVSPPGSNHGPTRSSSSASAKGSNSSRGRAAKDDSGPSLPASGGTPDTFSSVREAELIDLLNDASLKNEDQRAIIQNMVKAAAGKKAEHSMQITHLEEFLNKSETDAKESKVDQNQLKDEMVQKIAQHAEQLFMLRTEMAEQSSVEAELRDKQVQDAVDAREQKEIKEGLFAELQEMVLVKNERVEQQALYKVALRELESAHGGQVADLRETIVELRNELASSRKDDERISSSSSGTSDVPASSGSRLTGDGQKDSLAERLRKSQDDYVKQAHELTELRLQIMGLTQGKGNEVHGLQALLKEANQKIATRSFREDSQGKKPLHQRRHSNTILLSTIEEDDGMSVDESIAPSIVLSSGAGEGVGDLSDFDDRVRMSGPSSSSQASGPPAAADSFIARRFEKAGLKLDPMVRKAIVSLETELADVKTKYRELKVTSVGAAASAEATSARMEQLLAFSRQSQDDSEMQLQNLRLTRAGVNSEHAAHQLHMEEMLKEQEHRHDITKNALADLKEKLQEERGTQLNAEEVHEKLYSAFEAQRMAEVRIDDLKVQIVNLEREHQRVVAGFQQKLKSHGLDTSPQHFAVDESEDVHSKLQNLIEEHNLLQNSMEGQSVLHLSKIEELSMQHSAALLEMQKRYEDEVEILKSENRLLQQGTADSLRTSATKTAPAAIEDEADEDRAKARLPASDRPHQPRQSLSDWLISRCPIRASAVQQRQGPQESTLAIAPTYAQKISWALLSGIPQATAMRCCPDTLLIFEATRKAREIWGRGVDSGQNLSGLFENQQQGMFLKRAISVHQSLAEIEGDPTGFDVRAIGAIEFKGRKGGSFRSDVVVAHMPEEPALKSEPVIYVIVSEIEPHHSNRPKSSVHNTPGPRMEQRPSWASDVSSIYPADSASNA